MRYYGSNVLSALDGRSRRRWLSEAVGPSFTSIKYEHRATIAASERSAHYNKAKGAGSDCGFYFLAADLPWSVVAGMVTSSCARSSVGAGSSGCRYGVLVEV